jgi:acetylornithine deacetylase/succinyl-diaminopimelate desuccinylase-like protein
MSKTVALEEIARYFDAGTFLKDLERRVAIPTESQGDVKPEILHRYLANEMAPTLKSLGFESTILPNPVKGAGDFLIAQRIEDEKLPTVLTYGHGDVVLGMEGRWREGLSPWKIVRDGDKLYGRGTADNKGQHSINVAALSAVIRARGKLGFNCKILIETGEEAGSPGLQEICRQEKERLRADVFIASDGPRISAERPTIFLGNRGAFNFDMRVNLREGSHHSGNWGGALANPAVILAHALASMTTARGAMLVEGWKPKELPPRVRETRQCDSGNRVGALSDSIRRRQRSGEFLAGAAQASRCPWIHERRDRTRPEGIFRGDASRSG